MDSSLIDEVRRDCASHGYGRKKWWADQLDIPPLTLSHWLAGRQQPNGAHALRIQEIFQKSKKNKEDTAWKNYLWDAYYLGETVPIRILPLIISNVLSLPTVDSRTLALLSRLVEKYRPTFEIPSMGAPKNRLGWLLEVSAQKAPFKPEQLPNDRAFLSLASKTREFLRYLKKQQTPLGRKWHLFDCPIEATKESLHFAKGKVAIG